MHVMCPLKTIQLWHFNIPEKSLVFNSHRSTQVSHQLWLVWHLGLDPWHRWEIWQIQHAQVIFLLLFGLWWFRIYCATTKWRRVTSCHTIFTLKSIFFREKIPCAIFRLTTSILFQTEALPVEVGQGSPRALSWRDVQTRVICEQECWILLWYDE